MPLSPTECKLMTPELIDLYNRLEVQFGKVRSQLPSLAADPTLAPLLSSMGQIAEEMRRSRYRVGFLGLSQVGKSTTVNTILDFAICGEGAGAPTTSSITRVHGLLNGQDRSCVLYFMTRREFQLRRDDLSGVLKLSTFPINPQKDHATLLRENDQLLREIAESRERQSRPAGPGKPAPQVSAELAADLKYFERVLKSYNEYGSEVVGEKTIDAREDFAARDRFTSHLTGDDPTPYLLLREVEIGLPLPILGETLEVIDLPGLGTRLAADDKLTEAYLPRLDGALLFQGADQVASKAAYGLLSKLNKNFEGLANRVWMVITKVDGLTAPQIHGDASNRTLLDNLAHTLADTGVPHQQVLMVSNRFHKRLAETKGPLDPARYKDILGIDVADAKPVIPQEFDRQPKLRDAFGQVVLDGGISRIREVIGKDLARMVQEQVRRDVETRLRRVGSELARVITIAKERTRLNHDDFINALLWEGQVRAVLKQLDDDRVLEPPARELKNHLHTLFNRICSAESPPPAEDLPSRHEDYVRILRREAMMRAATETLPKVHEVVRRVLDSCVRKANLRPVTMPTRGSVPDTLSTCFAGDAGPGQRGWYETELDLFDGVPLYPSDRRPFLRPAAYRAIMADKIDAVVYQIVYVMEMRVKGHLRALQVDLSRLGSNEANVDNAGTATFDQLLVGLQGLSHAS